MFTTRARRLLFTALAVTVAVICSACQGLPRASKVPDPDSGRVLIIGDSLTVGARDFGGFTLPGRHVTISAQTGRSTSQGISVLETSAAQNYDLVVMALGTNDYYASENQMGAWVDRAMTAARGTPVVWVNVDYGTSKLAPAKKLHRALNKARSRHPNLTVADWHTWINSRPNVGSLRAGDGVHYTTAGYRARAEWMARVATGLSYIVTADEAGPVSVAVRDTSSCPAVVQLRREKSNHSVITVPPTGELVNVGDVHRGEKMEFYIRSKSGTACQVNWTYEIGDPADG